MEPSSEPKETAVSRETVLIVHRLPEVREKFRSILTGQGFQVVEVPDGVEAIHEVYQRLPNVIVTDISLSEINGYQLCRVIKNDPATRKIPVILVSSYDEKIDKFWGYKAGADAYIPHNPLGIEAVAEELCQQVNMLLKIYGQSGIQESPPDYASGDFCNVRTRMNQVLDKALIESTLMNEFRKLSDLCHDASLMNYMVYSLLESILDYDLAAIFYHDHNRDARVVTFHIPEGKTLLADRIEEMKADFFEKLGNQVNLQADSSRPFENMKAEVIGNTDPEALSPEFQTTYFHTYFSTNKEQLLGAVAFYRNESIQYDKIFPMPLILSEIGLLMKLRNLYTQAELRALIDDLTKLYHYRYFIRTMEREFLRAKRYGLDMSIAVIDIDHLKSFNQEWGIQVGDEVLKNLAEAASESFRAVDVIARSAGEEIMVLFPETDSEQAMIACERLRRKLNENPMIWKGTPLNVTISIGMCSLSDSVETVQAFVKKAEDALLLAKTNGCNRIEVCLGSD